MGRGPQGTGHPAATQQLGRRVLLIQHSAVLGPSAGVLEGLGPAWWAWVEQRAVPHTTLQLGAISLFIWVTAVCLRALTIGLVIETPKQSCSPPAVRGPQTPSAGLSDPPPPPVSSPRGLPPGRSPHLLPTPPRSPRARHFLRFSLWRSSEYLRSRVQCSCSFTLFSSF